MRGEGVTPPYSKMAKVKTEKDLHGLPVSFIDGYGPWGRLYVHRTRTGFVVTKRMDPGLERWVSINGKDFFSSVEEINQALQDADNV